MLCFILKTMLQEKKKGLRGKGSKRRIRIRRKRTDEASSTELNPKFHEPRASIFPSEYTLARQMLPYSVFQ